MFSQQPLDVRAAKTQDPTLDLLSLPAGRMGQDALSNVAGFVKGRKLQKKPVALVSVASAATVLVAMLGVYLINLHPNAANWG